MAINVIILKPPFVVIDSHPCNRVDMMPRAPRGRPLNEPNLDTYEGTIGNQIRTLRKRRYKTIAAFVDALNERGVDVKNNAVSMWELGERMPRVTEIWQIADALGVTLNTLIPKG